MRKGIVVAGGIILLITLMIFISSYSAGKGWFQGEAEEDDKAFEMKGSEPPVWFRIGFVVLFTVAMGLVLLFLNIRERIT